MAYHFLDQTYVVSLLIWPLETRFNEIQIKLQQFPFKRMDLKI